MAASLTDRSATVTTALGYPDANGVRVFTETLQGSLTPERRGDIRFVSRIAGHCAYPVTAMVPVPRRVLRV